MSEHTEAAIETTNAVTAAAAKFFGFDPITFIGLVVGVGGLIISIFSFLINWYYKRQENKRAEELHKLQTMKLMGKQNEK